MRLSELEEQIQQVMKNKMTGYKHKLELYAKELHGLSPTAKLINGFGYLEDQNGEPVTSVHKVKEGDQISLTISDGTIPQWQNRSEQWMKKESKKEEVYYGKEEI